MSIKVRISSQKIYALIVAYMLSFLALLSLINEVLNILNIRTTYDTMVLYGCLYLFLVLGFLFLVKRIRTLAIDIKIIYIVMVLIYLFTYIFYEKNRIYLFTGLGDYSGNPAYFLFLYSLPGYIFVRRLKDYDYMKKITRIFSYVVVGCSIIVFFLSRDSAAAQYLTFSYNMLFQLLFLICSKPKKNVLIHNLFVASGFFVFAFGGSRGALVTFLIALLLIYIIGNKNNLKKIFLGYAAIVCVFVMWLLRSEILGFLIKILDSINIKSRNLQFIANGSLFEDEIRLGIYQKIGNEIGLLGHGLMGDRVLLNGSYSHNLFLELLIDFGLLLGVLISIGIIVVIFRGVQNSNSKEHLLILMLLPNGFMELMFTGSYLHQEPALYILLGLCINSTLRRMKNESLADK